MGNSCGKILQEIVAGKLLIENLMENCCGKIFLKILRENLAEIVVGKSCGKLLWENC